MKQGELPGTRTARSRSGSSQSTRSSEEALETGLSEGVQEGGWVKSVSSQDRAAQVPEPAKQAAEARRARWGWVEGSIWTERMLEALEEGVKGGVWFSLIDKVYRPQSLAVAWQRVRQNGGSAGSDQQSVQGFERDLERNLKQLHEELRTGSYRPRPIRRQYIQKAGSSEKRALGIPAVRDRVVQRALQMVIEPIFERQFTPHSYGFRPGRGCKDALREVKRLLDSGYSWVVDADLKSYFDSIPHAGLMQELNRYIADSRVLALIEAFLKQDIMEPMRRWQPEAGTPQGAVISPLLANLYLHPVDEAMAEGGLAMIRYADDLVVLCRSQQQAQAALERLQGLIEERGLSLHPEKTRVVDTKAAGASFEFLGYRFAKGTRWPRHKSLKKLKESIRCQTRRTNAHSLEVIIGKLNRSLMGWFEYFKHSNKWTFAAIDGWTRRRLRSILRRRSKRKGISGGGDHQRWPNSYFRVHGLFCLKEAHRDLLQSS